MATSSSPSQQQMRLGDESPNPSAWRERLPVIGLAALGLIVACLLAAFQLGISPALWDPFFGSASSARVVESPIAHLLPIPDALLGVFGYLADLVTGTAGGRHRWRTRPWLVLLFGLVITGLALVGVLLFLMQALYLHSWCTLCLTSALLSLAVFALGISEPLASLGYLWEIIRAHGQVGLALWGRNDPWPVVKVSKRHGG